MGAGVRSRPLTRPAEIHERRRYGRRPLPADHIRDPQHATSASRHAWEPEPEPSRPLIARVAGVGCWHSGQVRGEPRPASTRWRRLSNGVTSSSPGSGSTSNPSRLATAHSRSNRTRRWHHTAPHPRLVPLHRLGLAGEGHVLHRRLLHQVGPHLRVLPVAGAHLLGGAPLQPAPPAAPRGRTARCSAWSTERPGRGEGRNSLGASMARYPSPDR